MEQQFYALIGSYVATLGVLAWVVKHIVSQFTQYIANDKAHTNGHLERMADLTDELKRETVAGFNKIDAAFGHLANAITGKWLEK